MNCFIPSAIPKIEYKTPQELDSAVFDIYRCTQTANIFGDIVAEDDAAHGRFARARLAHEEDLLLLGFLEAVHTGSCRLFTCQNGGGCIRAGNVNGFFEGMEYGR